MNRCAHRIGARWGVGFTLVELLVVLVTVSLLIGLLLPSLGSARAAAERAVCLGNLRQMLIAATVYAGEHDGFLMPALFTDFAGDPARRVAWDFIEVYEPGGVRREPGAMWDRAGSGGVMQCPSMLGGSNWGEGGDGAGGDPFTGYNYNTSYLGGPTVGPDPRHPSGDGPRWSAAGEPIEASARMREIRDTARCAVFGDGSFADGANKFMRAPFTGERDSDISRAGHGAGAQGFLHKGLSNAGFADGHAAGLGTAHRETFSEAALFLPETGGFLSAGNGLYDLEFGE